MMKALDVISRESTWSCDIRPVMSWLRLLPTNSVHMWGTSPPYYGLRDYGTGAWEGGDPKCEHAVAPGGVNKGHQHAQSGHAPAADKLARRTCKCGAVRSDEQIGLEESPEEYVAKMVEVFTEARRVLHPSGVLFLNLGDSYANDVHQTRCKPGPGLQGSPNIPMPTRNWRGSYNLKKKDLIGIPWRVAFALQEEGWYLRQWLPWVKRNPMTESVDDRPGSGCESIFVMSKSPNYYYDFVAVRREDSGQRQGNVLGFARPEQVSRGGRGSAVNFEPGGGRALRNTDLWFDSVGLLMGDEGNLLGLDCGVGNFPGQHFAVFPRDLIEPLVLAGSSERGVCPQCGNPWTRMVERVRVATRPGTDSKVGKNSDPGVEKERNVVGNRDPERHCTIMKTLGWQAGCGHGLKPVPAIVGDMFAGTGTTLMIAREHGRSAIGCDLDPRNMAFVQERMAGVVPNIMSSFLGDELETA